jgi:hypothetical protein
VSVVAGFVDRATGRKSKRLCRRHFCSELGGWISVEPGRTETLVHPALEGTVARGQGCCPWRVECASARMGAPRRTHQRRALALGREAAACDRLAACCRLPGRGRPGVGPFDPRGTARVGGLFGNDPLKECPPGWAQSETVARSFLRVARDPHCPPLSHCLAPRYVLGWHRS